jgi:hypothetical protein
MQLRWLEVREGYPNAICLSGICRVLQFCTLEPWEDPEMAKHGGGRYVWHDVPVVVPSVP